MSLKDIVKFDFSLATNSFFYLEGYIYNADLSKFTPEDLSHKIKNEDFLSQLSGEYSLIIWNNAEKELMLVRDKIGIMPLYYISKNNLIYISNNMSSLFKAEVSPLTVNKKFLKNLKIEDFTSRVETPWNEILKVPPASYMTWNSKTNKTTSYWQLQTDGKNFIDPASQLECIISERVRAQSDVGIFLSSGFDSTSLCFLSQRFAPNSNIELYSMDFFNKSASESNKLKDIISLLNFKTTKLFYEDVPNESLWPYPEGEHAFFFYNPNLMLFKPLFEKAKSDNKKVIWTGLGGDDIFGGFYSSDISHKLYSNKILWIFCFYLKNLILFYKSKKYYFTFHFFKKLLQTKSLTGLRLFEKISFSDALNFAIESEQHMANKFGIQLSYPLMDDRLIQSYATLISQGKEYEAKASKPFLRELMRGMLPENVRVAESSQSYESLWRSYLVKNKDVLFDNGSDLELESPLKDYFEKLHAHYKKQVEAISFRSGTQ